MSLDRRIKLWYSHKMEFCLEEFISVAINQVQPYTLLEAPPNIKLSTNARYKGKYTESHHLYRVDIDSKFNDILFSDAYISGKTKNQRYDKYNIQSGGCHCGGLLWLKGGIQGSSEALETIYFSHWVVGKYMGVSFQFSTLSNYARNIS